VTDHEEEIWAAADERSADVDPAPAGAGAPRVVRGYDKRFVYGIAGAVLAVFIGFSFLDGPSKVAFNPATPQPASVESGPLVADPPYAAARREAPAAADTAGVLVPPPSSAVIGGADGRPYATVGSGTSAQQNDDETPVPPGTGPAHSSGTESDEDPRRAAWRSVREAAPTSRWTRSAVDGAVAPFEDAQPAWDPELARQPAAAQDTGGGVGDMGAGVEEARPGSTSPASESGTLPSAAGRRGATFVVPALSRIEAALVTAVNSDVPGEVVAQVTRDVSDASGRYVAIPAGSLLLGKQSDQVAVGQRRLVIAWSALQLPDRTMVELPGLPATDETGAAGISGQVSSRAAGAFGRALLLSAIGAGFQLSQPQSGDGATPSAGRTAAAAVGQQLAELSAELLRRDVNSRPTIRLRQGSYVAVMVARDLGVPVRHWTRTGQ
jgi:type IV secretion system protein TrbI